VDPDAILPTPPGTITGKVFADTDNDLQFSAGDEGLGGVRVELYYDDGTGNPFGERLDLVETAGDGSYAFTGHEPGRYVVIETNLPGYESARDSEGANDDRVWVELTAVKPSAADNDFLDYLALPGATLTLHRLEPDAVANSDQDPDGPWPLEPVNDLDRLASLPQVSRGWVADGATPLILRATFRREDLRGTRAIRWRVIEADDGGMDPPLASYLEVVRGKCEAPEGAVSLVGPDCPTALAFFGAPPEHNLRFREGASEIRATVLVEDVLSGFRLAQHPVELRRPPVLLIHDFNSTGDWGVAFREALATEGRPFKPDDPKDNFVRTVRYGQEALVELGSLPAGFGFETAVGLLHRQNTFLPLAALVPLLHEALEEEMAALREDWAITQCDVVAHGQGGVLARMLASEKGMEGSHPGFRSREDFYAGRFRLVVTIGAPHNGSRLIAYLRKLDRNRDFLRTCPDSILSLGLFSPAVQDKFDPFGEQIRALNNPSAQSPWKPDPSAQFHRIAGLWTPITDLASWLGLLGSGDLARAALYPFGYDGFVDAASAAASPWGPEVPFTSVGLWAHSGPPSVFQHREFRDEPVEIQNDAREAGEWVRAKLTARAPTESGVGGRFPTPELLNSADEEAITAAARKAMAPGWEARDASIVLDATSARAARSGRRLAGAETIHRYRLEATDRTGDGEVAWFAEAFGPDGVSPDTLTVTPLPEDSSRVDVTVPDALVGDVVLYASYATSDGRTSFGRPAWVVERDPADAPISQIAIIPPAGEYPAGELIKPRLLVAYHNGTVMPRYLTADNLTAVSSHPDVVRVADPVVWELTQPGHATVTVSYRGLSATSQLTVRANPPADPGLWIVGWSFAGGAFRVTVTSGTSALLTLWHTPTLENAVWTRVEDAIIEPAGTGISALSDPHPAGQRGFYQVRASAARAAAH
jgi:hypothetical protein